MVFIGRWALGKEVSVEAEGKRNKDYIQDYHLPETALAAIAEGNEGEVIDIEDCD